MRREHISTTLIKQSLNTIAYLQKKIKPLPTESELCDFYYPSENLENDELLFVVLGTSIAIYALYKYLK